MNLLHYYWYFTKALSNKFCNKLINYASSKRENIAIIGGDSHKEDLLKNKNYLKNLKKQRNSNVVWLDDQWIYDEIHPYIHLANKNSNWNFQWDYSESFQFTKYKINQFYDWHCDSWETPYNKPGNLNFHNKIRKLSVVCMLSDPKDYTGGKLQFQFRNEKNPNLTIECLEILPKGSIIVFPSFIWHRVTPVTKGTRYSLVTWNLGYPFK
jgi:PKHD-type hydroxylase